MEEINFNELTGALISALNDEFRGFLTNNGERIEVPYGVYHHLVAFNEMSKIPDWKYEHGTGQNPLIDFMKLGAIYITKISISDKEGEYQRTVGYLTNAYSTIVDYRGKQQPAYEVFKQIAIEMGYDVDEYTLKENSKNPAVPLVSVVGYKGKKTHINKPYVSKQKLSSKSKPVLIGGKLFGFICGGHFLNCAHFDGYANIEHPANTKPTNDGPEK